MIDNVAVLFCCAGLVFVAMRLVAFQRAKPQGSETARKKEMPDA